MSTSKWILICSCCVWSYISLIQADAVLDDNFLLALDGKDKKIYQIALDRSMVTTIPITGLVHPVAVDYDPINKLVFWTDVGKNSQNPKISQAKLNGEDQTAIITLTRGSSPEGIAVDPYSRLIFYADNGPDHIRALNYDGLEEKTIVLNAHNPRCVRLDPVKRFVYWTDWGTGAIERARYDGSERTEIVKNEGAWINNIVMDFHSRLMYWTDAKNDLVQYSDLETGDNPGILIDGGDQSLVHYYGIAVDKDYVYITDWTKENIYFSPKSQSNLTVFRLNQTFSVVNSIHTYVSELYPQIETVSPCSTNTSGCQQICLPLGDGTNYTCECNDQTVLQEDGKSCELIDTDSSNGPDVIWLEFDGSNTGYVRGINGKPQTFLLNSRLQTWLVRSPLWHFTTLDYDAANQRLFLMDKFDKYITQLSLDQNLQLRTLHQGVSGETNGMAYDWLSDSLYWTDALYNWIRVAHAQPNENHVRTILTGLDHPHGIALDPKAGKMYWVDRGVQDQILTATLAGEYKKVILSSDAHLNKPTGITLDIGAGKLYWCNSNQLMSANLDGTGVKTLFATTANFVGITVQDNYVMAVDQGVGANSPYLWFFNVNSPTRVPKMPLYRRPEAITMYNTAHQPADPTVVCDCHHICVSSSLHDNHTQCLCSDGYQLTANNKTCLRMATAAAPGFVYSLGDRLCAVSIEDTHKKTINLDSLCFFGSSDYLYPALDFDYKMAEIYFSETKQMTKTIRRASLNDRQNNSVVVYGTGDVFGLAVDYVSDNLYWADFSRGQIWVSRVDGSHQKLLLDNRNKPRAIVLNIRSRKLYWSEFTSGGQCTIMSCSTDGSGLEPFVSEDLDNVTGLFVDYSRERLYWADQGEGEVESISFSGNDRQKEDNLNKLHLNTYDLALFEDIMGMGDSPVTSSGMMGPAGLYLSVLSTGEAASVELTYPGIPATYDVLAYSMANQPSIEGDVTSSCAVDNGFCEQLCLHITVDTYRCACVDGLELTSDNRTCHTAALKKDKILLVANDYRHTVHGLDPNDLSTFYSYKLPASDRPICVTYNPVRGYLYWSEFNDGIIKGMFVDGSDVRVLRIGETGSKVHGLVLDAVTENLYYTDSYKKEIGIVSPTGAYHKVLIRDSEVLANVHCIVLDVEHGHMYFSVMQRRNTGKILRADLDGTNILEVVNTSLQYPTGLALDHVDSDHHLYWVDKYTGKIEVMSLNGQNRRVIYQLSSNADPFGLALVESTLYWTDWNNPGLFHVNIDSTNFGVALENELHGLNGMEYVNMTLMASNSCTKNMAPPCTHFCIPTPSGPKCLCPDTDVITGNTYNCTDQTCSADLLFGTLSPGCGRLTGEECGFVCDEGYVNTTDTVLSCRAGFQWDKDISTLCRVGTCDDTIPNGKFMSVCGMTVGEQCNYKCQEGYVKHTEEALTCLPSYQWDSDLSTICQPDVVCLRPDIVPHSNVIPNTCKLNEKSFHPGAVCSFSCQTGYKEAGGSENRTCMNTGGWSGVPLQCDAMETTTSPSTTVTSTAAPAEGPIVGDGEMGKFTAPKESDKVPIVIGTIFGVAVLAAFLIVVVVIMYKRSQKSMGHYRRSTNYPSGKADDLVPVVGKEEFCPSYSSADDTVDLYRSPAVNNNLYTNQPTRHVKMDGSVAFSNPDYEDVEVKVSGEAMTADEEINCNPMSDPVSVPEVQVQVIPPPGAEDRTAFTNPLYANQQVILGEDVKESQS